MTETTQAGSFILPGFKKGHIGVVGTVSETDVNFGDGVSISTGAFLSFFLQLESLVGSPTIKIYQRAHEDSAWVLFDTPTVADGVLYDSNDADKRLSGSEVKVTWEGDATSGTLSYCLK